MSNPAEQAVRALEAELGTALFKRPAARRTHRAGALSGWRERTIRQAARAKEVAQRARDSDSIKLACPISFRQFR